MRDAYTIELPILDPRSASRTTIAWFAEDHFANYDQFHSLFQCGLVIVRYDSPIHLRRAVHRLARYFRREFGYDFVQYDPENEPREDIAFLWSPEVRSGGPAWGAASFRWREYKDTPPRWALTWIWLHPFERGKGHLTRAWPFFAAVFGDFHVEPPLSPAMTAFLTKQKAQAQTKPGWA